MSEAQSVAPAGMVYAVVYDDRDMIAWCPSEGIMVEALRRNGPWLEERVRVVRVADDVVVWPWMVKGGDA